MSAKRHGNPLVRLCWLLLLVVGPPVAAQAECPPGSLIAGRALHPSGGAGNADVAVDGIVVPEGYPSAAPDAVQFGPSGFLEWDLGQPTAVAAAAVQADANDEYRLLGSLDGQEYRILWQAPQLNARGLRERYSGELNGIARYLRLDSQQGDGLRAVSELRVYCAPQEQWPPLRVVRKQIAFSPLALRMGQAHSAKIVFGVVALIAMLFVYPRLRQRRYRHALAVTLIALAALAWTNFGVFQGQGIIQYWDHLHYFLGSKYYPETGNFELYRCMAKAEREAGRGNELDGVLFRDLDDGSLYPGAWTATPEGSCRASFSDERWKVFKQDIDAYRPLTAPWTISHTFTDHGYNATPLSTTWLRLWTAGVGASPTAMALLAQLDSLALLGAVALLYWGFGARAAVLAAVVMSVGFPWNYQWVGGSLGRHTWLLVICAGLALLRRDKPFAGMLALTTAALLRLFPIVFLGGAGLWVIARWVRSRELDSRGRRALGGVLVALIVGIPLGAITGGFNAYPEFVRVVERHSATPLTNQIGLQKLLGARASSGPVHDQTLTDPSEPWIALQHQTLKERRSLWIAAVIACLAFSGWIAWRGRPIWECTVLAGPLLFCLLPMTSYDYVWVALLVVLAASRPRIGPWVVGFALATQIIANYQPEVEAQHLYDNVAFVVLIVVLVRLYLRDPPEEELPSRIAEPAVG